MRLNNLKGYDIFTDFYIRHKGDLVMASLYGSEQIIKSLLASIDLNIVKKIELKDIDVSINITNPKQLKSIKKKIVNDVYEDMNHYMIYSSVIKYTEGATNTYVISKEVDHANSIWNAVKNMTATPLLDTWRDLIIEYLGDENKIESCEVVGKEKSVDVACSYINIESLTFLNDIVSQSIKNGRLSV